eukprot:1161053-Pelagomonas_calceolata.AAC.2
MCASQLNEDDMLCGLWRRRCNSEVTKSALSFIQTGHLELAQELLGDAPRTVQPDKLAAGVQAVELLVEMLCMKPHSKAKACAIKSAGISEGVQPLWQIAVQRGARRGPMVERWMQRREVTRRIVVVT